MSALHASLSTQHLVFTQFNTRRTTDPLILTFNIIFPPNFHSESFQIHCLCLALRPSQPSWSQTQQTVFILFLHSSKHSKQPNRRGRTSKISGSAPHYTIMRSTHSCSTLRNTSTRHSDQTPHTIATLHFQSRLLHPLPSPGAPLPTAPLRDTFPPLTRQAADQCYWSSH